MSLPTPYYDDGNGIVIFHADCRDILPHLPKVDLVLTDPPYGIAHIWSGGSVKHGWSNANAQGVLRNEWDQRPLNDDEISRCLEAGTHQIIWGGNYFNLPPSRRWLVWNKPERGFSLADAELAWTSFDAVVRVFDANRSDSGREHPTQKPIELMKWCLELVPMAQHIVDPYCGSGTTLRAAKDLGRKCIGIEIEEKYCEIAARRLGQEVLPL